MTKWTAPDIASIRGDNSRPLQKIFGSLTEYLNDNQNGSTLDSLDDVTITTPTAGQTLSYDAVTSLWKNATFSDGGGLTNLNASNLASGTVPTGRMTGSYTGITGLGTLTSLTIDGPLSPSVFFGDWNQNNNWSGIRGTHGYLLTGSSNGPDQGVYLRSESTSHPIRIGSNNTNTLTVTNTSATVAGTMNATAFVGPLTGNVTGNVSGSAATVTGASQTAITALGNLTTLLVGKVCSTTTVAGANDTGSFSVRGNASFPAVMSFHRTGAYAVNFGLSTSNVMELGGWSAGTIKFSVNMTNGDVTAVGGLNAYSISGNSNVAGTGNASYHPSGIYSTGTNWLYGTVLTNGNDIGAITQYVGAVYGNNWFRSSGDTGWYSQTYGGGIWMVDSTWVQTYNGKRFYSSGGFGGTVNYGSYGSMSLYGALNGWEGITFPEVATTWMSTANGQYFGIYRNNSTWNFYVVNGTFTPSDERYKRDIEPLQHGMNFIKEIVPITFDPLTEDPSDDPEQTVGRTHYGFTTQNILQALANVGETRDVALVDIGGPANESNESDRQYLNHSGLIAPMIKAIQELDQRLQQLETV